jgi:hypothetical protein
MGHESFSPSPASAGEVKAKLTQGAWFGLCSAIPPSPGCAWSLPPLTREERRKSPSKKRHFAICAHHAAKYT